MTFRVFIKMLLFWVGGRGEWKQSVIGNPAGVALRSLVEGIKPEPGGGDLLRRTSGEVGEGVVFDLSVFAEGLTQEDTGVDPGLALIFAGVQTHRG